MASKECEYCGHELKKDKEAKNPQRCGFCGAPQLRKKSIAGLAGATMTKWSAFLLFLCGIYWVAF